MDVNFLEHFYEKVILPQYDNLTFENVTWIDHGGVGLDTFAHYFMASDGHEYVLVFEDFPGNVAFNDGLSHDIVSVGNKVTIRFSGEPEFKYIENITGYFTLYKEKNLRE